MKTNVCIIIPSRKCEFDAIIERTGETDAIIERTGAIVSAGPDRRDADGAGAGGRAIAPVRGAGLDGRVHHVKRALEARDDDDH